jgi:hypothetical protein
VASRPGYRPAPPTLEADRATLLALQDLFDYTPQNAAYSTASIQQLEAALTQAQQAEARAQRAIEAARDQVRDAAWAFHNAILGAKAQVIAQYGDDSPAVQAIGLKKKSERKRPARRRSVAAAS